MTKYIYILFLVFLFGCSNAKREIAQLQEENQSLKIEIDSLYCEIDTLKFSLETANMMVQSNAEMAIRVAEKLKDSI